MNKTITIFLIAIVSAFSISASAQNKEVVSDTLVMGPGYANDIFYSMTDGEVSSVERAGWDLGFYTNAFSAGIIINEGNGVKLYHYPKSDTAGWATFDTTGMLNWTSLSNSNEYWEDGAFNKGALGHPDYGWGVYNMVTHGLTGDSLYLLESPDSGIKKLWIVDKISVENIYHLKIADIDGTNEQTVELDIKPFTSKNFVYYSIENDELIDREPADNWDILFTKYIDITYDNEGNPAEYLVTGATSNVNRYASKYYPVAPDYNDWSAKPFDSLKNIIGYDWKSYNFAENQWVLDDSTAFFVMNEAGDVYKLVFTYWEGMGSGKFALQKELVHTSFINNNFVNESNISLYPNPTSNVLNIKSDEDFNGDLSILDITGKIVYTQSVFNSKLVNIDVSELTKGLYFITLTNGNVKNSAKFIVK